MSEEDGGREEVDRSELIAHFQEITGLEDQDRSLHVLQAHHWNLEAAVQDTFNQKEGIPPLFSPLAPPTAMPTATPTTSPISPARTQGNSPPRPQAAVVPQQLGWWEWIVNLAFFPLRFIVSTASELLHFVVNLAFGFQPSPARNPQADVQHFVTEFEVEYGVTHPDFLVCSYSQALTQAKQNLRFLLVYLHSPGHQDTPHFCRTVLASQEFKTFTTTANLLTWAVGVNTEEGVRVSYILRENTYPFLALIVLKQSRMVVCDRVEGTVEKAPLMRRLEAAIRNNEGELVVERNERSRREADKQIREEQDRAYQESAEADREKERRKREELLRAEQEEEKERQREREQERILQEFETERALRISRLPPSPDPSDPTSVHVMLRMPDGQRQERRFHHTDKLESLYDFAYTTDRLPLKFTLVTNFPRKELVCDRDGGPALVELGLGRKCVLFVQNDTEE